MCFINSTLLLQMAKMEELIFNTGPYVDPLKIKITYEIIKMFKKEGGFSHDNIQTFYI